MKGQVASYSMIAVGVIGLFIVRSLRPPSGFSDAMMKAAQGQQLFLKEPFYVAGLIVFGGLLILGVVRGLRSK